MRRIWKLTLALLVLLGLAACAGENDAPPLYALGDVERISQSEAFTAELNDLEEVDADTAFALYRLGDSGLVREDLKESAVLRSAGATCEEAAVLVFTSADKAKTAADALQDYLAGQMESNRDYRPAEIPKLENALVDLRGETLLLVVANDQDAAQNALK